MGGKITQDFFLSCQRGGRRSLSCTAILCSLCKVGKVRNKAKQLCGMEGRQEPIWRVDRQHSCMRAVFGRGINQEGEGDFQT